MRPLKNHYILSFLRKQESNIIRSFIDSRLHGNDRKDCFSKVSKDAEEWDILQHIKMTPEERQKAAWELRMRAYGKNVPDVRKVCRKK